MTSSPQPLQNEYRVFADENPQFDLITAHRQFGQNLYQLELYNDAAWYADQVIALYRKTEQPVSTKDYEQAVACHYAAADYLKALTVSKYLLEMDPENVTYLRHSGLYHMLLGNLDSAEKFYISAMQSDPDDAGNYDALAHLYGLKGNAEKVAVFGNKALVLKDKESFAQNNIDAIRRIGGDPRDVTSREVVAFQAHDPSRNVIAFSLWGDNCQYTQGAILNATVAPVIYPGWQCRFYCDTSVPVAIIEQLKTLHGDVRVLEKNKLAYFGLFWRFFVAEDPLVDRYLIRDCDCVLNCKERVAVDEWIASGKHFHIMRDYASHTELIHAGLWGGVRGAIPNLGDLIVDYYDNNSKERTIDQRFLRHYIWPFVKESNLCHDSCFQFNNSQKFPILGDYPDGTGNVGMSLMSS